MAKKGEKMTKIVSLNLNTRNVQIYDKYFKNRKGEFSRYINEQLGKDYSLNELEHLLHVRDQLNKEIEERAEELERIGAKIQQIIKKEKSKLIELQMVKT